MTHLKHSLDLLDQRCYNYCTSIGISLGLTRMCMTYMIHNFYWLSAGLCPTKAAQVGFGCNTRNCSQVGQSLPVPIATPGLHIWHMPLLWSGQGPVAAVYWIALWQITINRHSKQSFIVALSDSSTKHPQSDVTMKKESVQILSRCQSSHAHECSCLFQPTLMSVKPVHLHIHDT